MTTNRLGTATILQGDARALPLPDASVDAIACDPPYGLEFMGKDWDAPWSQAGINADAGFTTVGLTDGPRLPRPTHTGSTNPRCGGCGGTSRGRRDGTAVVPVCTCARPQFPNVRAVEMRAFQAWCQQWATEGLRVLKPGGYLLAFGGTRTWHRLACAIEDAGFEIRDTIAWLYGAGFPKSLDVSKAIDKAAGIEREVVGVSPHSHDRQASSYQADNTAHGYIGRAEGPRLVTVPATEDAQRWAGWGTALKPGYEPIVVARKPLAGTVAANVLTHGTGAINVDGCRVAHASDSDRRESEAKNRHADFSSGPRENRVYGTDHRDRGANGNYDGSVGRWPTNVVLSHPPILDEHGEPDGDACGAGCVPGCPVAELDTQSDALGYGDCGGASRFFPTFRYEAKAPSDERPVLNGIAHPTVKPLGLMRWLCRLVTQPGGRILDMFAGSGTTAEAALLEGFTIVAIEREACYLPHIQYRADRARRRSQPGISRLATVNPSAVADGQLDLFTMA